MKQGDRKIRRALLSVADKWGVVELGRDLTEMGVELVSSGGTARTLAEAGVAVTSVKDVVDNAHQRRLEKIGIPAGLIKGMISNDAFCSGAVLKHRVATLHPEVHGGILAVPDDPEHQANIDKYMIELFDLVVVVFYPFSRTIAQPGCTREQAIEQIDIGGPALVRAAAKNHRYVTVVVSTAQYKRVINEMRKKDGHIGQQMREAYAVSAFEETMAYDSAIVEYLRRSSDA